MRLFERMPDEQPAPKAEMPDGSPDEQPTPTPKTESPGETPSEKPAPKKDPISRLLGSKKGRIAFVAILLLFGILSCVVIPSTIKSDVTSVYDVVQERRAYHCAKKAADGKLLHLCSFPSFRKTTIKEISKTSDSLLDNYCKNYCGDAWSVSGVLVAETTFGNKLNCSFTAKVIRHDSGKYGCYSFTVDVAGIQATV